MASVYDEIGGADSVAAAVQLFYEKVLADPSLAAYFEGTDLSRLKRHQRAFIAAALGGSELYAGRSMADAHAGLAITSDAFDQVVSHLAQTLSELGVQPETIGAIASKLAPLKPDIVSAQEPLLAS
jgi:hemoglobin